MLVVNNESIHAGRTVLLGPSGSVGEFNSER